MSTIGRILAAARDRAGYSIQELSARTYIRESVLEGIERDDFGPCGGDFYARGHIKAVCRELGIEPAELIERFDAEYAIGPTSPLMGGDGVQPVPPDRSEAEGGGDGRGAGRRSGRGDGGKDGRRDGRDGGDGRDGKGRDRRRPGGVLRPFRGPVGGGPREPEGGPGQRPPAVDEGVTVTGAGGVPGRPSSSGDDPENEAPPTGEVPPQEREPSAGADAARRRAVRGEAAWGGAVPRDEARGDAVRGDGAQWEGERAAAAGDAARGQANDAGPRNEAERGGAKPAAAASRREGRGSRARSDGRGKGEGRPFRRPPAGPPEDEFDEELDDAPWRRRWGMAAAAGGGAGVAAGQAGDGGADVSAAEDGASADGAAAAGVGAGVGGTSAGGVGADGVGVGAGGGHTSGARGAEADDPDDDEDAEPATAPSGIALLADRARRHWPVAVALCLLAAAVIAGIQAWPDEGGDRAAGSSGVTGEAGAAERNDAMEEKRTRREAVTQAQPAMSTTVRNGKRPDEVRVRVYALHRTWLSVTDGDGGRVFAGAVKKGTTHIWSDRDELRFHVGNAGGIHLEVNGVEEGVPGGRGQVKYLTFSADDLAE
ncbi:helix-turn-helix domain-containing protein [Nocardiopsis suaedae]|uniref:DUF4115 domain-containing protein n=1 Tax=Nocardiopsis suaedae TaxID=3018444 RepID=A0ABT4TRU4_9ACTN|nr:RodZ domain-containing protein [Nocardiopsis suaedae]MDA2807398.1 DUF4115 domain-containing protein [Nocardiopsis suaedae]